MGSAPAVPGTAEPARRREPGSQHPHGEAGRRRDDPQRSGGSRQPRADLPLVAAGLLRQLVELPDLGLGEHDAAGAPAVFPAHPDRGRPPGVAETPLRRLQRARDLRPAPGRRRWPPGRACRRTAGAGPTASCAPRGSARARARGGRRGPPDGTVPREEDVPTDGERVRIDLPGEPPCRGVRVHPHVAESPPNRASMNCRAPASSAWPPPRACRAIPAAKPVSGPA